MEDDWSSAHYFRTFPRHQSVQCMWSERLILRFYFVGQICMYACMYDTCILPVYTYSQVNHMPGIQSIINKRRLTTFEPSKYVPLTFSIPEQQDEFRKEASYSGGAIMILCFVLFYCLGQDMHWDQSIP